MKIHFFVVFFLTNAAVSIVAPKNNGRKIHDGNSGTEGDGVD
jgi:hypothetical protein